MRMFALSRRPRPFEPLPTSYRGLGAVEREERPRGVPQDWVLRSATVEGRSSDYDVLAARVDAMTDRLVAEGYYPHGWTIPENPEGDFGPAEVTYWGPPEEKDTWRSVGLVLGMAGAGLSVIGIGIALMESQY